MRVRERVRAVRNCPLSTDPSLYCATAAKSIGTRRAAMALRLPATRSRVSARAPGFDLLMSECCAGEKRDAKRGDLLATVEDDVKVKDDTVRALARRAR